MINNAAAHKKPHFPPSALPPLHLPPPYPSTRFHPHASFLAYLLKSKSRTSPII